TQSTSFSDTSVKYGQTYYYQVSAVNPVGEGNRSEIVSATLEDKKKPTADAGEDKTVKVGEEVTFDASSSSDNVGIASYEWNFDDGTTATVETIEHKFGNEGTYEVTLTVTDETGNTDTDTITVIVEKKDDNGGNGIPGFSMIILSLSISLAVLYKYKKRTISATG
ncbi:MAG: PKD domain-containing protein, partial [Thermoplasmata archaeon]